MSGLAFYSSAWTLARAQRAAMPCFKPQTRYDDNFALFYGQSDTNQATGPATLDPRGKKYLDYSELSLPNTQPVDTVACVGDKDTSRLRGRQRVPRGCPVGWECGRRRRDLKKSQCPDCKVLGGSGWPSNYGWWGSEMLNIYEGTPSSSKCAELQPRSIVAKPGGGARSTTGRIRHVAGVRAPRRRDLAPLPPRWQSAGAKVELIDAFSSAILETNMYSNDVGSSAAR